MEKVAYRAYRQQSLYRKCLTIISDKGNSNRVELIRRGSPGGEGTPSRNDGISRNIKLLSLLRHGHWASNTG
jgi:hypothetical protein